MRVQYKFRDAIDIYDIDAEIYPSGKAHIVSITDSYGTDVDIEDFSEYERNVMHGLAYEAKERLDGSEEPAYDVWGDQ
jgi:hypothetical protein